ncbi:hypothetical protein DRJ17_06270 [Candidatus Woesearchaeota archaeon]|nr:MAG: hypothetical protein DRJ17_06270 [Candidatus Woesearchaeota archaeon]
MKYRVLNTKEKKKVLELLEQRFGFDDKLGYTFLQSAAKIYLANRELFDFDIESLRINNLGVYFCEIIGQDVRLSVEGSQLIGPKAKKNVVELNSDEFNAWLKGMNINVDVDYDGFVIVKHGNDYAGCGRVKNNELKNYLPKTRRISKEA